MLNIVLFGPPGSGKGTQSDKIVEKYKLAHLSTGDILREEVKNQTETGKKAKAIMDKGELVSDSIVVEALENKTKTKLDAPGIVFDGFPRTIPQAGMLDEMLDKYKIKIDLVIAIDVNEEELMKRLLGRAAVLGRSDDNEATIHNRIEVYKNQTLPLFEHYKKQGKLHQVAGVGSIDDIFGSIVNVIEKNK